MKRLTSGYYLSCLGAAAVPTVMYDESQNLVSVSVKPRIRDDTYTAKRKAKAQKILRDRGKY